MAGGGSVAESVKARIRRGTLIQSEEFRLLLELASVGEIAVHLGKSAYAAILKDFNLEEMRRSELEFLLGVSVLAEGVTFRHYADLSDRKLLDLWLESFDITLFKNHFRRTMGTGEWGGHMDAGRILGLVSDFRLTLVDQEKLLSGGTLRDIVAAVRSEPLRAALSEAIPSRDPSEMSGAEFQKTSFNAGMILDRYYFDNLYAAAAALGGEEGRMLRALVGTRVDLMNLYWIYRARRFFNMAPEEALTLLVKARCRADFELLTKVAFAEPRALAAVLRGTAYEEIFDVENSSDALREVEIESRIKCFLFAAAQRVFLTGSLGFQNIAAYLTLKELEVRDLVAVVESVRYGFDRSKVALLLARPLGKGN
ncbi:MAG: V-type ATPase subunit [Synergistaceae bacterium]|jgi:V/A-type H+-transporting ATPase subunit C|nr:V-type ATPase subunit [Synergistaceae bacterium]